MIATVVERGNYISAYDAQGVHLFTVSGGARPGDGLIGYFGSSVTVRQGG